MRKAAPLFVLAVALTYSATAGAANFRGIVVAKKQTRHALVVASRTGVVRTIRVRSLKARVGSRVSVAARPLRDGTFRATRVAIHGRAHRARIHGVVARSLRARYLVSAGHSVIGVRKGRRLAAAGGDQPGLQPGDVIDATVKIDDNGELDEEDVDEVGHVAKLEVEGKLVSIAGAPPTSLVVQPGDGAPITVAVPAGFTLPSGLATGDEVELKVVANPDGTLTLQKLEVDDNGNGEHQENDGEHQENDGEHDNGSGDD